MAQIEWFLALHWLWYIPSYIATGVLVTGIAMRTKALNLNKYSDPVPPGIISLFWPLLFIYMTVLLCDAIPRKIEKMYIPKPRVPRFIKNKIRPSKESPVVEREDELVPQWARWQ